MADHARLSLQRPCMSLAFTKPTSIQPDACVTVMICTSIEHHALVAATSLRQGLPAPTLGGQCSDKAGLRACNCNAVQRGAGRFTLHVYIMQVRMHAELRNANL